MKGLSLIFFSATTLFGQGTILWNESVNGPISPDFSNPTPFGSLITGTNSVIGTTEVTRNGNGWITTGDYFTFQVSTGSSLTAVFISVDKANVWSWLGDAGFSTELGFVQNSVNGDLLQQWALAPLGSGFYGMYLLNAERTSDLSIANYRLDFLTASVPEPNSVCLLMLGIGFLGFLRWRRRV